MTFYSIFTFTGRGWIFGHLENNDWFYYSFKYKIEYNFKNNRIKLQSRNSESTNSRLHHKIKY